MGFILLTILSKPKTYSESKNMAILTSLIVFCLLVPQVETDMSQLFANPITKLQQDIDLN